MSSKKLDRFKKYVDKPVIGEQLQQKKTEPYSQEWGICAVPLEYFCGNSRNIISARFSARERDHFFANPAIPEIAEISDQMFDELEFFHNAAACRVVVFEG